MIDRFEMTILVISNTLCVNVIFFFHILYNKKNYVLCFCPPPFFLSYIHNHDSRRSKEREQKGKGGIERVCRAKGKVSSGTPSLVRQAALIHVHRVRFSRWLPRMAESIPETF